MKLFALTVGLSFAISLPSYAQTLMPYPITPAARAERDLSCYMHGAGRSFSWDLTKLCGAIVFPINTNANAQDLPLNAGVSSSVSSGRTNPCKLRTDIAKDGDKCGETSEEARRARR